jgi:hypothetical protein
MPDKKLRAKRQKRSAAEVLNANNVLVIRKMVQEGLIPADRLTQLIREFDPTVQAQGQGRS